MPENPEPVRARHEAHAAVRLGDPTQRDPDRHLVVAGKSTVPQVLVPAHAGRRAGLLGEERRSPAQDVGPKDLLDRIEDARMADQIIGEAEHDMAVVELALVSQLLLGDAPLEPFELGATGERLLLAEHVERKMESVPVVPFGNCASVRRHSGHRRHPRKMAHWNATTPCEAIGLQCIASPDARPQPAPIHRRCTQPDAERTRDRDSPVRYRQGPSVNNRPGLSNRPCAAVHATGASMATRIRTLRRGASRRRQSSAPRQAGRPPPRSEGWSCCGSRGGSRGRCASRSRRRRSRAPP